MQRTGLIFFYFYPFFILFPQIRIDTVKADIRNPLRYLLDSVK